VQLLFNVRDQLVGRHCNVQSDGGLIRARGFQGLQLACQQRWWHVMPSAVLQTLFQQGFVTMQMDKSQI
jgi:hypothetical protein